MINKELQLNNYFVIKEFISKEESKNLDLKFKDHVNINLNKLNFIDPQVPNAKSSYNYIPFVELLCHKLPKVSEIYGESLLPTYSYARIYENGSCLDSHLDRPSCEVSLTLHLDGDSPWPFFIETPSGESKSVILDPGDAIMYLGRIAPHWREAYSGNSYTQVFLHYVETYGECSFAFFDHKKNNDGVQKNNDKIQEIELENSSNPPELIITNIDSSTSLKSFIKVFDNIVPESLCDLIIDHYSNSDEWKESLIGTSEVNKTIRNCSQLFLSSPDTISKDFAIRKKIDVEIHQSLLNSVNQYRKIFPHFNATIDTGYDLLRYNQGQFYIQHTDSFAEQQRSVSCSVCLNDDYEGGEFAFFNRELKFSLKKGSVIMFPSNFMYPHEIMPVTKGTRYSIITWYV